MTGPQPIPRVTSVRTVGVPVRDQARALAFYTGVLGLQVSLDMPAAGGTRWIEVSPPDGATTIALIRARPDLPAGVETGIRLSVADADSFRAHLASHDTAPGEMLRWPGVPPMFAFRDPDGNGLEIVQYG